MRRLIAIIVLIMCQIGTSFAKPACTLPTEVAAVQLRQLQIEMMISTMRCSSKEYDFRQHYAAFMAQVNPLLDDNAKQLKTMLHRLKKNNLDMYMTSMSNDAQNISQADPEFCTTSVQILEQVASMPTKDIPAFAAKKIPSPYEVVPCPAKPEPKKKSRS